MARSRPQEDGGFDSRPAVSFRYLGFSGSEFPGVEIGGMSWLGILLASIGASLILGALTFVSALIGALITAMIVLMCGPLIDRLLARRNRPPV
jgi:hypothetical protein